MPKTLEERVDALERDMATLKGRSDRTDERVAGLDADLQTIPDLIKVEFRVMDSKFRRLEGEFDKFKVEIREDIKQQFDAAIRAISEVVAERGSRG